MLFSPDGPLSYCRWLTRSSGSNFALGLRLLPKRRREAMEVIYAFCRAVDDVVDREEKASDPASIEKVRQELTLWRRELALIQGGYPTHPIVVALQPVLQEYRIPIRLPEMLMDGVEMDLVRKRYTTFEDLRVYCEHVASVVGLISIRVFGCEHPEAEKYAVNLGIALQLTNILRDLKTDLARGRVYLPQEEMSRFGYSEKDLASGRYSGTFLKLMDFQCERAREFFRQARQALESSGECRKLLPAQIMGGVYARLLSRIEQSRYNIFADRISVPKLDQLLVAARVVATQGRWGLV